MINSAMKYFGYRAAIEFDGKIFDAFIDYLRENDLLV